jgi:hypothetical protein
MTRVGTVVVALEGVALLLGVLAFGLPALLVGAPLLVCTLIGIVAVRLSAAPRRRLAQRRAARWDASAPASGGLMSGFFEAVPPRR